MASLSDIPISVLDLAPVPQGSSVGEALRRSLDLARSAERLGYRRFWMAEHHNMPGIASAATSVALGYVAGGTERIRVGAGGVMLPNHAPLLIAEQFGTLEALYPNRIDLGIGRAPGSDRQTTRALRRDTAASGGDLPELLAELRHYLADPQPGQPVVAVPGAGAQVPIWLLGSSGYSAELAGRLGLPYAAAGHFAPEGLLTSLERYRAEFRPSAQLSEPYVLLCVNVILADTDAEAERLATSQQLSFLNLVRGIPGQLPPPVDSMQERWSPREEAMVQSFMKLSVVGGAQSARVKLDALIDKTGASELMVHAMVHDHQARLRSYELVAGLAK